MCTHGNTKEIQIPAGWNGSGRPRRSTGSFMIPIDSCIADLVHALNHFNIGTRYSCCGHGKSDGVIELVDGRVLTVHRARE